MSKILTHELKF